MRRWPSAIPTAEPGADAARHLQCMEVWGGNLRVDTSVVMPGLDAWVYSLPATEAGANDATAGSSDPGGGDVHYVSSCAGGALTRMLVADVAGHGPAVADIARRLRRMMQRHIVQHEQTGFVRALNREFAALAQHGQFATAVAFTYDAPINRLLICNAGHPPPLIFRSRQSRWEALHPVAAHAGNVPLGIEAAVEYEQFETPIEVGDLVMCHTDALIEARRDEKLFGEEGIFDFLHRLDPNQPQHLIKFLVTSMLTSGWEIRDDLTMLLFRPNGLRPHLPLHDRVLAPFRYFKGLLLNW